jgi:hypothetical protein
MPAPSIIRHFDVQDQIDRDRGRQADCPCRPMRRYRMSVKQRSMPRRSESGRGYLTIPDRHPAL